MHHIHKARCQSLISPPIKDGNETIDEDEEELGGGPFTMAIVEEITLHMNFEQHVIFAKSGYYQTCVNFTPTRVGTLQAIQMFVM